MPLAKRPTELFIGLFAAMKVYATTIHVDGDDPITDALLLFCIRRSARNILQDLIATVMVLYAIWMKVMLLNALIVPMNDEIE